MSSILALAMIAARTGSYGATVYQAEYNKLDLDDHPMIVTNVTFEGLATLVDITNIVDDISTNLVPALRKEIADASEAGTNYVDSATNSVFSVVDAAMDKKLDSTSVAPKFDATRTVQTKYEYNELVSKDGVVYQCTNASGHYGAWDPGNWTAKPVSELYEFEFSTFGKLSDIWTCNPEETQYGTPFSVKWIADPTEGEGWALFTGNTKQGKVLGDESSTELSWSPGAGTAFYDVSAVRQLSGVEYHLDGQPDVKLQPAGDYVPASRTVNGQSLSSNVTLTGANIAVSGTDPTKINAALAGKATKADATLTERGFSAWEVTPATFQGLPIEIRWVDATQYGYPSYSWEPFAGSRMLGGAYNENENATTFYCESTIQEVGGPISATRTALQGYVLGPDDPSNPNRGKPLATEAEAEALRNTTVKQVQLSTASQGTAPISPVDGLVTLPVSNSATSSSGTTLASSKAVKTVYDAKLDKAAVVAPSSTATTGQAADAKSTGDALEPLLFAQYYPEGNVKSAAEFTAGIKYTLTSNATERTAMVKPFCNTGTATNDNSSLSGRVVIPPFVDAQGNPYISDDGTRYKVVEVGGGSLRDNNANLTTVVAPNTVTNIGGYAFTSCRLLTSVSLPAATTSGGNVFRDCTSLASVSLPAATTISFEAFRDCSSLASVSLPVATSIGTDAFRDCSSLASVDFGDTPRSSVPSLGADVFDGVPTSCKIIVPDAQYDAWTAASRWSDLVTAGYKFLRHSEWEYARRYELQDGIANDVTRVWNTDDRTQVRQFISGDRKVYMDRGDISQSKWRRVGSVSATYSYKERSGGKYVWYAASRDWTLDYDPDTGAITNGGGTTLTTLEPGLDPASDDLGSFEYNGVTFEYARPGLLEVGTLALTAGTGHEGNLAALDANGDPTDSGLSKDGVESLLLAQYYPEGNVKSAAEFTSGIKYDDPDTTNRTITVKQFRNIDGTAANDNSNLSGRVVIPPFVDGGGNPYISDDGTRYKVVGVGNNSSPSAVNTTNLTAIVAPNTVTNIGESAFYYCTALTSVSLPGATSIGDYAFGSCAALKSVSLPAATSIGASAFAFCSSLTSASLPSATTIGSDAFYYCNALTSVSLPDATSIGSHAFYYCTNLASVSLPVATTIGDSAFERCAALASVSLPDATSIGSHAFYYCTNLASVSLPVATTIGDSAFERCAALASVSLPAATSIGASAFAFCSSLTSASLPSATSIGSNYTFRGCAALTSVSLPAATAVGEAAFASCGALASVSLPAAQDIGKNAFGSCAALKSVSLPAATNIVTFAFSFCSSLTSVDFGDMPRSDVPSLGSMAFNGVPAACRIIVPYTQYDDWIAADGWKNLPQAFVRHSEKADKPTTFTAGNLAKFDANGNPVDSGIAKTNVLTFAYDVNSNRTAVTVGVPRRNDPNFEADTPVIDETTGEFVTVPAVVGPHSVAITGDGESSSYEATIASGEGSFALNHGAATNRFSVALGNNTFAAGVAAISHGEMTAALGDYSHSEGYETRAYGDYSHAEGDEAIAFGFGAHAEGYCNEARGAYSHVEGAFAQTSASAWYAHSSGVLASATNHTAYVWQGATYDNGNPDRPDIGVGGNYYSHGLGTYNINPNGGLSGFWVGETNLAQHVANLTAGKLDASSAFPAFSEDSTYAVGKVVSHDGGLYICRTAVTTAGEWDDADWTATTLDDLLSDMVPLVVVDDEITIANIIAGTRVQGNDANFADRWPVCVPLAWCYGYVLNAGQAAQGIRLNNGFPGAPDGVGLVVESNVSVTYSAELVRTFMAPMTGSYDIELTIAAPDVSYNLPRYYDVLVDDATVPSLAYRGSTLNQGEVRITHPGSIALEKGEHRLRIRAVLDRYNAIMAVRGLRIAKVGGYFALNNALSGEAMPSVPTQNELAEAVKKIFTALGGTVTP